MYIYGPNPLLLLYCLYSPAAIYKSAIIDLFTCLSINDSLVQLDKTSSLPITTSHNYTFISILPTYLPITYRRSGITHSHTHKMASNQQRTILITGATGYVGGQIVREALSKGYHVRIAARTTTSASKVTSDFPEHASQLSTVIVPDITKAESFEEAFTTGTNKITGVIHTASPFVLAPEDNVRDLLEPAIRGSVAILEAAKRWGSGSVKGVVATSSFASIVDIGLGKRPGYTYTEADWNPMTYEEAARADGVTAYCASKALAERASK